MPQNHRGNIEQLRAIRIVGKVVSQEQYGRNPFVITKRVTAQPGTGRSRKNENIASHSAARSFLRIVKTLIVWTVIDKEEFTGCQEGQPHRSSAFRYIKIHDSIRARPDKTVDYPRHIANLFECVAVGPFGHAVVRAAVLVIVGVAAVLPDSVPLEVADSELFHATDQLIRKCLPVRADKAHTVALLGFPHRPRLVLLSVARHNAFAVVLHD